MMGVKSIKFLRHPDAELVENLELREEFVREIRKSKPDVLLTFDPNVPYRFHPDHRVVGRVALDAAWPSARDPLTFPKAGPPHETAEAWASPASNHARDRRRRCAEQRDRGSTCAREPDAESDRPDASLAGDRSRGKVPPGEPAIEV